MNPLTPPSNPTTPRAAADNDARFITIGPTVSLDAGPIVIPILSCVFGFPVLALAIICALRYRAMRARKRAQMKRLQAASDRWRNQDDQLRATTSGSDAEREASFAPRDPELLLTLPEAENLPHGQRKPSPVRRQGDHQNGRATTLRVPKDRGCRDLDNIMAERSDVDFEYTEVDIM